MAESYQRDDRQWEDDKWQSKDKGCTFNCQQYSLLQSNYKKCITISLCSLSQLPTANTGLYTIVRVRIPSLAAASCIMYLNNVCFLAYHSNDSTTLRHSLHLMKCEQLIVCPHCFFLNGNK